MVDINDVDDAFASSPTSTRIANSHNDRSVLTMPMPSARAAPEKFSGSYSHIREFITHYELLLIQHNVDRDEDRCEIITRYCSRKVTEFIQALPSYSDKSWAELKSDLLQYYDADLDSKKYKTIDLINLVKSCKNKKLKNLSDWRKYGRKFITIGGWLLKRRRITEDEYATHYWNGIPRSLRTKLENRLVATNPTRSLEDPFQVTEINTAAEALLQRHRFDSHYMDSDEDSDISKDDSDSDEDSEDSDSEDDLKRLRRRIKKRAKYSKGKPRASVSESESEDSDEEHISSRHKNSKPSKKKVSSRKEPDIESLIKELNTMSISDPKYAALVFRAMKLDPDILKVVRAPVFNTNPSVPPAPYFPRQQQSHFQPQQQSQFQPQRPPHMNAPFPPRQNNMGVGQQFNQPPRPQQQPNQCFACNGSGHMMSNCPTMNELVARGAVIRNPDGRWTMSDGNYIKRFPGESIAEASRRIANISNTPSATHLIRAIHSHDSDSADSGLNIASDDEDSFYCRAEPSEDEMEEYEVARDVWDDSDAEDSIAEEADEPMAAAIVGRWNKAAPRLTAAYPVEPADRITKTRRREVMEGVYVPARKSTAANKENAVAPPNPPATRSRDRAHAPEPIAPQTGPPVPITKPPVVPRKAVQKPQAPKMPVQVPVEVRKPAYDGRDDAMIVDHDQDKRPISRRPLVPTQPVGPNAIEEARSKDGFEKRAPAARRSEVAVITKPLGILNQMLNTRIELAFGEVLGISRELSSLLGDKIKPKSVSTTAASLPITKSERPPPPVQSLPIATSFHTKSRGLLIQLQMQCAGRPITAIIDTGSQLNIVNKETCDSKIRLPVDYQRTMSIADANGGNGQLIGLVSDVPLGCGRVRTMANVYVGTHVPFELLLGRPWQRQNLVSIDERHEGTYLIFKDRHTHEPRYEILASEDDSVGTRFDSPPDNAEDSPGAGPDLPDWCVAHPASLFIESAPPHVAQSARFNYDSSNNATTTRHTPSSSLSSILPPFSTLR